MARRRSPSLRRRRFSREPKLQFVIYCEGKNTEPAYFRALKRIYSDALIEIETVDGAGVPYTLANKAADRIQTIKLPRKGRNDINSFEDKDQVWAVFDRDEHPRFKEAVIKCERFGVGVARSNPCFELWLILHEEDYDKPEGRHAVQAHFKKLHPEYSRQGRKTPNCEDLIQRMEVAEERAETLLRRRTNEGNPFGPPSSTVGRLTSAIRRAANVR